MPQYRNPVDMSYQVVTCPMTDVSEPCSLRPEGQGGLNMRFYLATYRADLLELLSHGQNLTHESAPSLVRVVQGE